MLSRDTGQAAGDARAAGDAALCEAVEAAYACEAFRELGVYRVGHALHAVAVPDEDFARLNGVGDIRGLARVTFGEISRRLPDDMSITRYALSRMPLPRLADGRLDRRRVADLKAAGRPGGEAEEVPDADRDLLSRPLAARLWSWLQRRFPDRGLNLDSSPALDLDLDSLDWLALVVEMENDLHVALDLAATEVVGSLREFLVGAETSSQTPSQGGGDLVAALKRTTLPPLHRNSLRPRGAAFTTLAMVLHGLDRILFRSYFRLQVEGLENLDGSGPMLLVANHLSDLDALVLPAALPWSRLRRLHFFGAEQRLFGSPLMRLLSRAGQVSPISDRIPAPGLATALAALAGGEDVCIFPEMWRSPDGKRQPFLAGVGVLAKGSGARLVPTRIDGTFERWPRWRRWPSPGCVRVVFGRPLAAQDLEPAGQRSSAYHAIAAALGNVIEDMARRSAA